jgi:hypothetical protein
MGTVYASNRQGEHGGARFKLIVFLVIAAVVIYSGYLYIPVAVAGYQFKDLMQNKVDLAAAQGYDGTWLRDQLVKSEADYSVPTDAAISPAQHEGRVEVHVQYVVPISVVGFTYHYQFDETVKSTTFLTIK